MQDGAQRWSSNALLSTLWRDDPDARVLWRGTAEVSMELGMRHSGQSLTVDSEESTVGGLPCDLLNTYSTLCRK